MSGNYIDSGDYIDAVAQQWPVLEGPLRELTDGLGGARRDEVARTLMLEAVDASERILDSKVPRLHPLHWTLRVQKTRHATFPAPVIPAESRIYRVADPLALMVMLLQQNLEDGDDVEVEITLHGGKLTRGFNWPLTAAQAIEAVTVDLDQILKRPDNSRSVLMKKTRVGKFAVTKDHGPPKWPLPRARGSRQGGKGFSVQVGWRYTAVGLHWFKPPSWRPSPAAADN